jgi:hypothetical protein
MLTVHVNRFQWFGVDLGEPANNYIFLYFDICFFVDFV